MPLRSLTVLLLLAVIASAAPADSVDREIRAVERDWASRTAGGGATEEIVRRLVALEPSARLRPGFWSLWGRVNLEAGKHRDAALGFTMARRWNFEPERTDPGLARSLIEWSYEFSRGPGEPPEPALKVLLRCREVIGDRGATPGFADLEIRCLGALAAVRRWSMSFQDAEELYRELIRRKPEVVRYRIGLARTYLSIKCPEKALVEVEEARRLRPDPDWLEPEGLLGTIHTRLGHEEQARRHYERFLAVQPDHPAVLSSLVDHYLAFERYEKAVEVCRRLVGATPSDHASWFRMASALRRLGRAEEAEEAMVVFRRLDEIRKRRQGVSQGAPRGE